MIGNVFETLIAKPIFNLLTLIYAYIPGHNLGAAIICFTIVIRLMLWPLLKKQLHSSKAMREVAPDIKRIKQETKGDRARESQLTMELYKERGIKPFSSLGMALIQLPILLALFQGINRIVTDPTSIITYSYEFIQNTPWMQQLATDISQLDATLFGIVDLTRKPLDNGAVYWPALIIVLMSAVVQYFASKMLMVTDKEARSLKQILKDAGGGKEADQSEVNAATMRGMRFVIPVIILVTSINFAAALGLYWLTSGIVQFIQQWWILGRDKEELAAVSAKIGDKAVEGEVIPPKKKSAKKRSKSKKKKR